jgi:hypothetical protein
MTKMHGLRNIKSCGINFAVLTFFAYSQLGSRLFLFSLDHALTHTTVGRTPLDEGSARRRDLYLTTHNTHKRQTSMPQLGFEPTIPASARPQTYAVDRAVTGIGGMNFVCVNRGTCTEMDDHGRLCFNSL